MWSFFVFFLNNLAIVFAMVPLNKWLGLHMKYLCKISNQIPWTNYCKSLKFCVGFILRISCMNCFCEIKYQANVLAVQWNKRKICEINLQRNNFHGETWQNIIFTKYKAFTVKYDVIAKNSFLTVMFLVRNDNWCRRWITVYWEMTYNLVCLVPATLYCACATY